MFNVKNKEELVRKWESVKGPMSIKAVKDPYIKENLAQLLQNQESKDFSGQDLFLESDANVNTGNLDASGQADGGPSNWQGGDWRFRPVALALMRRTFPDLFANKVVGVQAMSTPVGLSYALRFTYNRDGSGAEAAWDNVPAYGGFSGSPGTSAALDEVVAPTTAANSGVYGTSGTGALTSAGEVLQIPDSRWDCLSACNEESMNEIGLRIDQIAIEAQTRKLAASFSLEAAQDIKAMHGVDIEREMVNVLQYEITAELDRELLYRLKVASRDTANGGRNIAVVDVADNGSGVDGRWSGEKYMNIVASIVNQANMIAISTRRGPGNFVIVSPAIASALQAAGHQWVNYSQNTNPATTMAAIGKLNGTLDVYRDQYATNDYALIGYKGPGVSDAGVIFSPYIMGLQNRAVSPDTFAPRVGVMSRYAITDSLLGAGRYYRLIPYGNVQTMIPGAGY